MVSDHNDEYNVDVCLYVNVQRNIALFLVGEVVAVAAIVLITLFAIQNFAVKQMFVGIICDIFNIAMYGAPCLVIVSSLSQSFSLCIYLIYWVNSRIMSSNEYFACLCMCKITEKSLDHKER